jgi:predicted RNA-binding Zn-ribbon protein involved in translation (DUF1610 family)
MSDFNDSSRDLYIRGMTAARAKDYDEAKRYLEWALRLNPNLDRRVDIMYWMSESVQEPAEKRHWLEEALANNPSDMRCRRALALLDGKLKAADVIDPDQAHQPAPSAEPVQASADRFVCPQCGGRMTFAPDGKSLTCEYCEARQSITKSGEGAGSSGTDGDAAAAESFLLAMATRKGHIHPANRQTFNCQGCGTNFILTPGQLSITCPYCGSAYVVRSTESRELIDPRAILPFQINESRARDALKAWFEHIKIPHDTRLQVERAIGIYLPVWSFEMAGQVPWHCLVEKSRNRWEAESGLEIVYHASVIVPASTHLCEECAAELREFDLRKAPAFDERYLADWPAETYQVNLGDASLEARSWTYEFEKQSVRDRFLQPVRDLSFNSRSITIESFQLALLPVWLAHYQLGPERYEVVVNAISGAVRGQRPLSWLERILKS